MRAKISLRLGHLKNSFFGLIGFIIPTIITFAAYKLLVEGLGETGFGVYLIATSIGGAMAFMDMGISSANIKFVAEDAHNQKNSNRVASLVWTSAVFYTVVGLMMMCISFLLAPWLAELFKLPDMWRSDSTLLFTLAALQVAALLVSNVFVGVLKALGRFDLGAAVSMITPVLSLGGGALGIHYGIFSLLGLMWLGVVGSLSGLFFGFILSIRVCAKRGIVLMSVGPTIVAFKRMFQFSAVLTFHTFAAIFFNQIQRLLIGWSLGPVAVGVFQFPYIAMSKVHALLNSGSEFLYPESSANKKMCEIRQLYLRVFFVVVASAFILLGFIAVLADFIFGLWLGGEISLKVAPLVFPLAVAFFFVAISIPAHHLLNGMGKPIWNVYYSLCNVVVYVVALFFLNQKDLLLTDFAIAFMISNVLTGMIFQMVVEFVFWPRWLKSE